MTRKKTVALKPTVSFGRNERFAVFTVTQLALHLGVSRQRASVLLNTGRILGVSKGEDGRWSGWLPILVSSGARGPVGGPIARHKAQARPTPRPAPRGVVVPFPKLGKEVQP